MTNQTLRWIARILGGPALLAGFWHFLPMVPLEPNDGLGSVIYVLGLALAGYVFAWFKEKEGGIVLTTSAVLMLMYIFYSTTDDKLFIALVYVLPLLISGSLFLWLNYKRK